MRSGDKRQGGRNSKPTGKRPDAPPRMSSTSVILDGVEMDWESIKRALRSQADLLASCKEAVEVFAAMRTAASNRFLAIDLMVPRENVGFLERIQRAIESAKAKDKP